MVKEMQEFVCHCSCVNTFPINTNRDGNYIIVCDKCGHQHCRVCIKGVVTGERWESRYENIPAKSTARKYTQQEAQKRPKNDDGFLSRAWLNLVRR